MDPEGLMDGLRKQVRRTIGDNVLAMNAPPEKQWWNLSAKSAAGHRIADEERARALALDPDHDPHNDEFDAMRHARWSNRMATEIGPIYSKLAGVEHELDGTFLKGHPVAEAMMDLRNNAEGHRAAVEGRAINPANLQTALGRPSPNNRSYAPRR